MFSVTSRRAPPSAAERVVKHQAKMRGPSTKGPICFAPPRLKACHEFRRGSVEPEPPPPTPTPPAEEQREHLKEEADLALQVCVCFSLNVSPQRGYFSRSEALKDYLRLQCKKRACVCVCLLFLCVFIQSKARREREKKRGVGDHSSSEAATINIYLRKRNPIKERKSQRELKEKFDEKY